VFQATLKKFDIKLSDLDIRLELLSYEAVRVTVKSGDCVTAISDLIADATGRDNALAAYKARLAVAIMPLRPVRTLLHQVTSNR
jgi:hypothetical protein